MPHLFFEIVLIEKGQIFAGRVMDAQARVMGEGDRLLVVRFCDVYLFQGFRSYRLLRSPW